MSGPSEGQEIIQSPSRVTELHVLVNAANPEVAGDRSVAQGEASLVEAKIDRSASPECEPGSLGASNRSTKPHPAAFNQESQILDNLPLESPPLRSEPRTKSDPVEFWDRYNRLADIDDREFAKGAGSSLDTLLIFAGLFSAVNTSLIVESLHPLEPDQAEKTNQLLRSVILTLQVANTTHIPLHDEEFQPDPRNLRTAIMFFASLCFSLTAAFGAMMAKQWLNYYEREGAIRAPQDRAIERQRKYDSRHVWHMEGVIETLPTLLQISLFLFLVALVDYLWTINTTLAHVAVALSPLPLVFYLITTGIAISYPTSPFQTRLSVTALEIKQEIQTQIKMLVKQLLKQLWQGIIFFLFPTTRGSAGKSAMSVMKGIICAIFLPISVPILLVRQARRKKAEQPAHPGLTPDETTILNCLTFLIQRSARRDALSIINSLPMLPLQSPRFNPRHPSVKAFADVALDRLLDVRWDVDGFRIIETNTKAEGSSLVNLIHLIFVRCGTKSNLNPSDLFTRLLWRAFTKDPSDTTMVSQVVELLDERDPYSYDPDAQAYLSLILEQIDRLPKTRSPLPYVRLLAWAVNRRILRDEELRLPKQRLMEILPSVMWQEGVADLTHKPSAKLYIGFLSREAGDYEDTHNFSQFLYAWFTRQSESLLNLDTYCAAIWSLLRRHANSNFWPKKLEEDGHALILLKLLTLRRNSKREERVEIIAAFLTMWNWRHRSGQDAGLYINEEVVANVARHWAVVISGSGPAYVTALRLLPEYLEMARRSGYLQNIDLADVVREYKKVASSNRDSISHELPQLLDAMDVLLSPGQNQNTT